MAQINAERARQISDEGYSAEHDDAHKAGEIARAAACYAQPPKLRRWRVDTIVMDAARGLADPVSEYTVKVRVPRRWPWDAEWWKPSKDRVRELVKAGALFLAESERAARAGKDSAALLNERRAKVCARKIDRMVRSAKGHS